MRTSADWSTQNADMPSLWISCVPWRRVAGLSFEVDVTQERNKIDQRLLR